MPVTRTAARADDNQRSIIEALEAIGCIVVNIRWPVDLLVGIPGFGWLPMEVKDGAKSPSRRALTDDQAKFIASAPRLCPTVVVVDPEGAIRAVNSLQAWGSE